MNSRFLQRMQAQNDAGRFACAGLDPVEGKMPADRLWKYHLDELIDIAAPHAGAFKPNWAFYLERALEGGLVLLERICKKIRDTRPDVLIVLDMKCADIGPTNLGYVRWAFDICGADAITVHSYMGSEAMQPILGRKDRGVFVLCKTSNPGASQMQDVQLADGRMYCEFVADTVAIEWNDNENCGLVVGATYHQQLARLRDRVPRLPFLIPGIGTQGGDLEQTARAAFPKGRVVAPAMINTSSGFMYQPSAVRSAAQLILINDCVRTVRAGS